MKNKELRKAIIEDGTLNEYRKERRKLVYSGQLKDLTAETFKMSEEVFRECEQARKCQNMQRTKIQNHIDYLLNKTDLDIYFGTWTFSDRALELTPETRKKAITRLLGKTCADYITNIDYGKETGREHYHGVIALQPGTYQKRVEIDEKGHRHIKIDLLDDYKLGWYGLEQIWNTEKDSELLAKYITKLTQHSIKVRQSYVSVKKGSEYQTWKKYRERRLRLHEPYVYDFMEQQAELYQNSEECPF